MSNDRTCHRSILRWRSDVFRESVLAPVWMFRCWCFFTAVSENTAVCFHETWKHDLRPGAACWSFRAALQRCETKLCFLVFLMVKLTKASSSQALWSLSKVTCITVQSHVKMNFSLRPPSAQMLDQTSSCWVVVGHCFVWYEWDFLNWNKAVS